MEPTMYCKSSGPFRRRAGHVVCIIIFITAISTTHGSDPSDKSGSAISVNSTDEVKEDQNIHHSVSSVQWIPTVQLPVTSENPELIKSRKNREIQLLQMNSTEDRNISIIHSDLLEYSVVANKSAIQYKRREIESLPLGFQEERSAYLNSQSATQQQEDLEETVLVEDTSAAKDTSTFFGDLETNVTASLGETAFLRCRLKANSPQHQVTWVRVRDWHILTSGQMTYTADARFRIKYSAETTEWTLEIKYLQKKDDGTYHCQVPTNTGRAVHAFHLHVASPQAVILGGDVSHVDIHIPSFTLVCIIDNTPNPPQVVFWYHNGTLLNDGKYPEHGNNGGLVSSHLTFSGSRAMSMLTLHNIQHVHSGNYTCDAPNAEPDTTQLFVTQRHEQAAVLRSSSVGILRNFPSVHVAALIGHVLAVRRRI